MNGSYGAGMQAFDRLFAMLPWLVVPVGIIAAIWLVSCWRDA